MATISVSLPADGSTADVADYNTPITTVVNAINGNLDSNNISSLTGTKITAGTIPGTALDSSAIGGWIAGLAAPNTIACNGNRSYTLTFNSVNYSTSLSPGMRLRSTRTVAAPTQCTSLNGSTQYYSKSSPNKLTVTDDITTSSWVKLTSYADCTIISRYNGTSGWTMRLTSTGLVQMAGFNAGAANYRGVQSYQSIPLNKWVHITSFLDMSGNTYTSDSGATNNYIMIDGVVVPGVMISGGTSPAAFIQAGDLQVGRENATFFFPGKLAQTAVFSARVTPTTMRTYISQGLAGTETSLASAYSFNSSIIDLNTTTPNDLTANGSAVATNADSPFGGQGDGTISSTLDYGIVQSVSFSTNTTVVVQVPEGCTIPTSGGVSAIAYSSTGVPYGFPKEKEKWRLRVLQKALASITSSATYAQIGNLQISVPVGAFDLGYQVSVQKNPATSQVAIVFASLSTATNSASDDEFTSYGEGGPIATSYGYWANRTKGVSLAATTPYYFIVKTSDTSGSCFIRGDGTTNSLVAENAYL